MNSKSQDAKKNKAKSSDKNELKNPEFKDTGKKDKKPKKNKQGMNELSGMTEKTKEFKQGQAMNDAMNNDVSSFIPDLMSENIVKNYSNAENIYGPKIIKYLSGYSSDYTKRNINIPEFQKELRKNIKQNIENLKKDKVLNKNYQITKHGKNLSIASTLFIQMKKLDQFMKADIRGKYTHKYKSTSRGDEKFDVRNFRKGDIFKDLALKASIKSAIRRGHKKLNIQDLKSYERKSKANATIIFAIDASSSMRGVKIEAAKKAGISLAYKTIYDNNKLGLIEFSDTINNSMVTKDFGQALNFIQKIKIRSQTDLGKAIMHSINMFPQDSDLKHLMILSDILTTKSEDSKPEEFALNAAATAKANNISVSLIIIDNKNKDEDKIMEFASQIIEVSGGKIYKINNLDDLDTLVLSDYSELI